MVEDYRGQLTIGDIIEDLKKRDSFNSRVIALGLSEIGDSGEYESVFIPEPRSVPRTGIEASHMAMLLPGSATRHLVKFFPTVMGEEEMDLERYMVKQMNSIDVRWELEPEDILQAAQAVAARGLHVLGAFQIGTFEDRVRSTELIIPSVFTELAGGDLSYATDLSLAFILSVQD